MPAGPCKFDRSATFSAEQRVITHRGGIRKMAKTRGTGLLMVWTDVDPEHEAEFNRWYNEEHLNRLLSVPGFLSAGRYRAIRGGPKYLAIYELEDHHVMRSSAFLDEVRYRPSPARTKASGGFVGRNFLLNVYRQIYPAMTNPIELTMGCRRICRWGAWISRPRWRRSSTPGTTRSMFPATWPCRAVSAHDVTFVSKASRN